MFLLPESSMTLHDSSRQVINKKTVWVALGSSVLTFGVTEVICSLREGFDACEEWEKPTDSKKYGLLPRMLA